MANLSGAFILVLEEVNEMRHRSEPGESSSSKAAEERTHPRKMPSIAVNFTK